MILAKLPCIHIAHIEIECQTPLSIKSDEADPVIDSHILRDPLDNPIIPATSIAGVLNHLYLSNHGESEAKQVFGYAKDNDSQISYLQVGFARVHNQHNQPQTGTPYNPTTTNDPILDFLRQTSPVLREQVQLNEYGVAANTGKFDRSALPKGTRFSFTLGYSCQQQNPPEWQKLLKLLQNPMFRLGGLTHRGFGKIKVNRIEEVFFNLKEKSDLQQWQKYRQGKLQPRQSTQIESNKTSELKLKAEDFWRIGQGSNSLRQQGKPANNLPWTETIIHWQNNQAKLQHKTLCVPASSIKGALRHRTLFHLRKLQAEEAENINEQHQQLCQLFGKQAEENSQQGTGGIIIDDFYLKNTPQSKVIMHNKIDRFSGGVINHALFSEEALFEGELAIPVYFDPNKLKGLEEKAQQAFINSINDLAEGRLALGANANMGHGYFSGQNHQQIQQAFKQACQA